MEDFKITMQELLPDLKKSKVTSSGDYSELYVRGLASNTTVDLHDDRMAETAIEAFKKAIDEGMTLKNGKWSYIPLRSGHKTEWDDILGWILKAETDDDHNLWIEAQLDTTNPVAVGLYKKLTDGDKPGKPLQLGLSVGGKIKKASFEWNQALQKKVRIIEDVMLNEISVVSAPANPPTYLDVLAKSVNWDEILAPNEELLQERAMSDLNDKEVKDQADVAKTDVATTDVVKTAASENENTSENSTTESTTSVAAEEVTKTAEVADEKIVAKTEEVKTDPQASTSTEVVTSVPSMDALVKTCEQLQTLLDEVKKNATPTQEVAKESTEVATAAEVVTPDVDLAKALGPDLDTRIAAAVAVAFESFRKEQLEPLSEKLSLIKGAIDEMGDEPMDKSSSVRKAKDFTAKEAKEIIEERLEKARQSGTSSLREAINISING